MKDRVEIIGDALPASSVDDGTTTLGTDRGNPSVVDALERYLGPPDLHDGTVIGLDDRRPTLVVVRVRGASGQEHVIHFKDVRTVTAVEPIGMMLYALAEMRASGGVRRFVFANWDEEGNERLEIEAREVTIIEATPHQRPWWRFW